MALQIEWFTCDDGDGWFSLVDNGDVVTGVAHATRAEAEQEAAELARA